MKWYITKRLLMLIPVLLGASIIAFSLIHLAPGDPARTIAGEHASVQTIEKIRVKYGLDKPLITQYWIWLKQALQGDFGRSIVSNEYVSKEIWSRFPNTVELTLFAMFIAIIVGVLAGIISASHQYSLWDYSFMGIALFGVSMPVFWLGIMLMMIFGVYLRWLPISGTRSSMLEVLRQDFIRTERAKGLSERLVIYKHAVRNALIPVVTVIGLNFGLLLAGAILTETVFSWPGVGRYVVNAVQMRDYPAVQGCVLFFSVIFVIVNLITDIIYVYIDPRIKYQ
ncbi:MAG: hypothetical protein XE09_0062 [Atribacteria bacterium 34_868]|nr:MAG: hypothetical protein XE09_0062 [Atribacteria bacterium 34_868]